MQTSFLSSEALTGVVERVTFYNEENGYTVVKITPEKRIPDAEARDGTVAVVGGAIGPTLGPALDARTALALARRLDVPRDEAREDAPGASGELRDLERALLDIAIVAVAGEHPSEEGERVELEARARRLHLARREGDATRAEALAARLAFDLRSGAWADRTLEGVFPPRAGEPADPRRRALAALEP